MSSPARKPVVLLILDGWGLAGTGDWGGAENSAVELADTPVWDRLRTEFPMTQLIPHGTHVGLTAGQMGNSEVGHLNLGAGRTVYQDLVAVTLMIEDCKLSEHAALNAFLADAQSGTLHFVGLFSDGGVHSHIDHLLGFAKYAAECGVQRIAVHALLDGRDTPPAIAEQYFVKAEQQLPPGATFATLGGRYFGMDRDRRWERVRPAWEAIIHGEGTRELDWREALQRAREAGQSDEFVLPVVLGDYGGMQDGDSVFFFNFRADRMRELGAPLALPEFDGFDRGAVPKVSIFSTTRYRDDFTFPTLLTDAPLEETLAQVASAAGLRMYKSAETEKYAHVTYFFNGGREEPWPGEDRVLVQSPGVATYDLLPEMSAAGVTELLCEDLAARRHDVYVINYANGDMVGHTGVRDACIRACEAVDACVGRVLDAAGWGELATVIVTADHGNCDVLSWPDGTPHTQHSMNLVPLVLVAAPGLELLATDSAEAAAHGGWSLRDVAPTILALLGLPRPASWNGRSLLR
jgi:2,3-bisphosphoglycerate-independent phosphoglycerate mutase